MAEPDTWKRAYEVVLTDPELAAFHALARARLPRLTAGAVWTLALGGVAVGFVAAVAAIGSHVVAARSAAIVATGGTAACWAGSWLYQVVGWREARRRSAAAWAAIGKRYVVTFDDAGLRWDADGRRSRIDWWLLAPAETVAGALLVYWPPGGFAFIPGRCLSPDWPAPALAARLGAVVRTAQIARIGSAWE